MGRLSMDEIDAARKIPGESADRSFALFTLPCAPGGVNHNSAVSPRTAGYYISASGLPAVAVAMGGQRTTRWSLLVVFHFNSHRPALCPRQQFGLLPRGHLVERLHRGDVLLEFFHRGRAGDYRVHVLAEREAQALGVCGDLVFPDAAHGIALHRQ